MLTANSDPETELSLFIVLSPFRNLSPKLDLRTDLVSTITNPHGTRSAKISRIILRAAIEPPATFLVPGFRTYSDVAMGIPNLCLANRFIFNQL
jgi:hypothetical protein